jgi:hypothetical protein
VRPRKAPDGRPNGLDAKLRGQGPRAEAEAARRLPPDCSNRRNALQPACPPRASKMREAARPPGRSQAATASASCSAAVIVLDHALEAERRRPDLGTGAAQASRTDVSLSAPGALNCAERAVAAIAARPLSTRLRLNVLLTLAS